MANQPNVHVSGQLEEAVAQEGENAHAHWEDIQTPPRKMLLGSQTEKLAWGNCANSFTTSAGTKMSKS